MTQTAISKLKEARGNVTEGLKPPPVVYTKGKIKVTSEIVVPFDEKQKEWRYMRIEVGISYSIPLHPEHQEIIKKLKDGGKASLKVDTGATFNVARKGADVTFSPPSITSSTKATVPHKLFN